MKLRIQKYYTLFIILLLGLLMLFSTPDMFAKKHKSNSRPAAHKVVKKKSKAKSKVPAKARTTAKPKAKVEMEIEEMDDDAASADGEADDEDLAENTDSLDEDNDNIDEDEAVGVIDDEELVVTDKNGNEEIIEVPEGLVTDSENGDTLDWLDRQYLSADSAGVLAVNPSFTDSIYLDRLKRLPTAIEMPWNPVVQRFIDRYTGRLRRTVSIMLGAQNFYMPVFEQALEVYGIPQELKYLPVIESALKCTATSPVGAAGQWQFMVATGKRYGLRVNSLIDERRDPVKASYAAAHYLNDLYQIFGDWSLVIAAYNCGPGNIRKAIQRSGGKRDFWEIYPWLPSETRGYVPAFIAANYIMTYYCEHNIVPMTATLPEETDTVMLYQNLHFKQVAEVLGISIEELRALNPQYRRDIVPGYSEPSDLRLPKEYISRYIANEQDILNYDVSDLMKRDVVEVNDAHVGYNHVIHKRNHRSKHNKLLEKSHKKKKSSKNSKKSSKKKSKKGKKKHKH